MGQRALWAWHAKFESLRWASGPQVFWGTPTYAYMLSKLEEWKFFMG